MEEDDFGRLDERILAGVRVEAFVGDEGGRAAVPADERVSPVALAQPRFAFGEASAEGYRPATSLPLGGRSAESSGRCTSTHRRRRNRPNWHATRLGETRLGR